MAISRISAVLTSRIMVLSTKTSDQQERAVENRAAARIDWRPCRPATVLVALLLVSALKTIGLAGSQAPVSGLPMVGLGSLAMPSSIADRDADKSSLPVHGGSARTALQGKIDAIVFGRLRQLGIRPANQCSDEVFVRRVYLDAIGTLPTAEEARQFLLDRTPNKRSILIDRLLERDEFADYLAMRWVNLLRVKSEFPINLWPNAVQSYHRWIRTSIGENVPYDRFVREMLTASGSNFRRPQVNFYRAVQSKEPEALAQAVALSFMGARAEKWPKERWTAMAVFFSRVGYKTTAEWKEEMGL